MKDMRLLSLDKRSESYLVSKKTSSGLDICPDCGRIYTRKGL